MSGRVERVIRPARRVRGRVQVPGDKSVSHRALILGALATGRTRVRGLAPGDDCGATRQCLGALGVSIGSSGAGHEFALEIDGLGLGGLREPGGVLDARNSGTTARLLMGVLAAHAFRSTMSGDASLRRRPMDRVAHPLTLMGARIATSGGCLPAVIEGAPLRAISYMAPVASAQVKTAILLAGLHASGTTTFAEPAPTRDHTERALAMFGVTVAIDRAGIHVTGGAPLQAADVAVPGDPSAAAFWAAAAAALPGSEIEMPEVGLNPTRTAFLGVLRRAGAHVVTAVTGAPSGEPVGTLTVSHAGTNPVVIAPDEVPGLVDELPVLAALATHGGSLVVTGAQELRVKESDRISALAAGLRQLGGDVEEFSDGFAIDGTRQLAGGVVDAAGDHRLAMAFAIAALGARDRSIIRGADAVSVSYPGFFEVLEGLCE